MSTIVGEGLESVLLLTQGFFGGAAYPCFTVATVTACIALGSQTAGAPVLFGTHSAGSLINLTALSVPVPVNLGVLAKPTYSSLV